MLRKNAATKVLQQATSYPWGRDHRGNLIGANGEPIYFMGADSVLVEHAPTLMDTLLIVDAEINSSGPASERLARIERAVKLRLHRVEADLP